MGQTPDEAYSMRRLALDQDEHSVRLELLRVRSQVALLIETEALLVRRLGDLVMARGVLDRNPVAVAAARAQGELVGGA